MDSKLELKSSTMSSDTGYLRESFSNNTYYSVSQCGKDDFKSYENSGAELKVSERNTGYADLNDIALNENQPYDNNVTTAGQEEEDRKKSQCRQCNCVISILSAAVLVGCAIVLCLLLLCKLPGLKCIFPPNPPPSPTPPTPPGCIVLRGATCYFQHRIALRNITEIRFIKETVINKVTLFNVTSITNVSHEIVFDETNKMTFNISVQDAETEVSVHISDTQCNQQGNYNILAISDENGFEESFFSVIVIAQCPCQLDLNITSTGEISCSFSNAENTSIIIQKLSGDMQNVLVNESGIISLIDLHTTNGFSATWSKDGTLNITIVFGRLNCSHEGDYNIIVTMNGTSTMYDVYLHVIDHPQKPVIAAESAGIIENKGGKIGCRAMTGCSKAKFEFVLSGSGNDIWDIWRETNQPSSTLTTLGWKTQSLTTVSTDQVTNIDKRKFRCSYLANREIFTSLALCIGVIPANFCQNDTGLCNYQHPYLCDKYISCGSQTNPLERQCSDVAELHFLPSGSCGGNCVWPLEANCTHKNYCD